MLPLDLPNVPFYTWGVGSTPEFRMTSINKMMGIAKHMLGHRFQVCELLDFIQSSWINIHMANTQQPFRSVINGINPLSVFINP